MLPGRYFRMHMVGYFEGIDSELSVASLIQSSRSALFRARSMAWKRLTRLRAVTRAGTAASIVATVVASPFEI